VSAQDGPSVTAAELVAAAVASYDQLQEPLRAELLESDAMEQVAQAWLDISIDAAVLMVPALIETLELLIGGEDIVTTAKRAERWRLEWDDRQRRAVEKIREAAELLQGDQPIDIRPSKERKESFMPSEQTSRDRAFDLKDANTVEWLAGWGHLDIVLHNMADALESARVGPIALRWRPVIPADHIGRRGQAAELSGAFSGASVRQLHSRLPLSLSDNYALIARLAAHVGVNINRQYVRSILFRGHT